MSVFPGANVVLGLVLAPFLLGVINRIKAMFAGRRGPPLLQAYYDLAKLLRKGAVYSRTTTWVFRVAPVIGLVSVLGALALLPALDTPGLVAFPSDLILFAYCLGLMRFFTVAAAMDTGSSFEGMGASREVQFSALAEPALILSLAVLARTVRTASLTGLFGALSRETWAAAGLALALVAIAVLIVFLAENARIPVDDPNTHLELTMIHEVMVLDYSGPDLAFILYAAALKLWVLGGVIVNILLPLTGLAGVPALIAFVGGMLVLAVAVGVIESVMARLSLLKVPQLLVGASALATLAFVLVARYAR